jgi:hypothetical protein
MHILRARAPAYVSIRRHTPAYVSTRQHTSAYVSIRRHTSASVSIHQHTSAFVSKRLASARRSASLRRCCFRDRPGARGSVSIRTFVPVKVKQVNRVHLLRRQARSARRSRESRALDTARCRYTSPSVCLFISHMQRPIWLTRPSATRICGLELLVHAALSYSCMRPGPTRACGLEILVHAALSY